MFQIWEDPKSGKAMLLENLGLDEQGALSIAGLNKVLDIEAKTKEEAQEKFIEWCHQQCPDAKVDRVSSVELRSKLPCFDGLQKKDGSRSSRS